MPETDTTTKCARCGKTLHIEAIYVKRIGIDVAEPHCLKCYQIVKYVSGCIEQIV